MLNSRWAGPNPARGDLFIDSPGPYPPLLFVFQRRGGSQVYVKLELFPAAPLKNKKEGIIRALFL
jgi:hypothetical protein